MENEVVTAENIEIIKERLKELCEFIGFNIFDEELNIGDTNISLTFPDEEGVILYSITHFLKYTENIQSLKVVGDNTVRTTLVRQTVLEMNSLLNYYTNILDRWFDKEGYTVFLTNIPFLIACIATKNGWYSEKLGLSPCSFYTAIEIRYTDSTKVLDENEENELISRILFYLSEKYLSSIKIGKIFTSNELGSRIDFDEEDEEYLIKDSDLLNYTYPMDMYREALSISNEEIQFLYYYKIIEYYSPLVAKQKSYEILNQRLDTLAVCERTLPYLDSFFSLTREYDISMKDSELANTVLQNCIDIIPLYEFLPDSIQKKLRKHVHEENIDVRLAREKVRQLKELLAKILYETRNHIVHAKSNYTRTGNECVGEVLRDMNVFMGKLCLCIIIWNDRLPENMRLK